MASTLAKYELDASWIECANCGIAFAVSEAWEKRLRNNHQTFYCPSGHANVYNGKTDAQRVREEMQVKLDEANRRMEWLRSQVQTAEKAEKRAKTKLKKMTVRVEAGVCPYCNRTFKQLAAHMKCKHGDPEPRKE